MKMKRSIGNYLKEMRIKSWLKNAFVFFPIVFSMELFIWDKLIEAIILALAFCLISSAIYVLNDISDVEKDRKHEVKKNRPIASGAISFSHAWLLLIFLMVAGFGLGLWVNLPSFILLFVYVLINIMYSKWLKTKAIIDCFCIAAGFLLRVLVGGTIVSDGVSDWMFLTVLALSLFMAFGKRRGELHCYADGETRDVLEVYEMSFLNGIVFMCAGLSMVFYSLWSVSEKTDLIITVPVVLFIIMRYLLLVFSGREEADPTSLILSDKTLLVSCGVCALIMIVMLY